MKCFYCGKQLGKETDWLFCYECMHQSPLAEIQNTAAIPPTSVEGGAAIKNKTEN